MFSDFYGSCFDARKDKNTFVRILADHSIIDAPPKGSVEYGDSIDVFLESPQQSPNVMRSAQAEYEAGTNTKHVNQRMAERGFTEKKKEDIKRNYSQKLYQEGGRMVYAKRMEVIAHYRTNCANLLWQIYQT